MADSYITLAPRQAAIGTWARMRQVLWQIISGYRVHGSILNRNKNPRKFVTTTTPTPATTTIIDSTIHCYATLKSDAGKCQQLNAEAEAKKGSNFEVKDSFDHPMPKPSAYTCFACICVRSCSLPQRCWPTHTYDTHIMHTYTHPISSLPQRRGSQGLPSKSVPGLTP